jgi:hypothetical protein
MASARHRRRGGGVTAPDRSYPGSFALSSDAGTVEDIRVGYWSQRPTIVRGFPPALAPYQRIFASDGHYVPELIWHNGYRALDFSEPLRDAQGQNMAFGFVQKGYRYSFALADLGVAQGHPTDFILPACIAPRLDGTRDPLWDVGTSRPAGEQPSQWYPYARRYRRG